MFKRVLHPPYYGLRDYGGEEKQLGQENSPKEYIDNLVNVFRIIKDKLSDDGTLCVNLGDSYYNYRPAKVNHILNSQYLKLNKIYQINVINVVTN